MEKLHGYFKGEFTDDKDHLFKFQIGKLVASSLSAFIAGVVFASIFWLAVIFLLSVTR